MGSDVEAFCDEEITTLSTAVLAAVSVAYTIAASASPSSTLPRVAFTFCSREAGVSRTPAAVSASSARRPQGTAESQRTTTSPGRGEVREPDDVLRVVALDCDCELVAGEDARLDHISRFRQLKHGHLVGRGDEIGGRALLDLRDDRRRGGERQAHFDLGVIPLECVGEIGESLGERRRCEDGQLSVCSAAAPAVAVVGATRRSRHERGQHDRDRQRRAAEPGGKWARPGVVHSASPISGTSITTLVAFTAATASTPGSRCSSSAASRVMSETTLCGPAWIST